MTHLLKNVVPPVTGKDEANRIDLLLASEATKSGQVDEAMKLASGVLNRDPYDPGALFITAWAFIKMERWGIAHALLKRSLEIKQRHETYNNLAMASIGMQRLREAITYLEKALRMDPENAPALANMALIYVYECMPEKAIESAERSLKIDPGQWSVKESIGYANLMLGNWKAGWEGYEAMIGRNKQRPNKPPHDGVPYWDGGEGLDLYLRGEQGMGDEISFASILPEVAAKQKSLVFECHPKLGGLFKRSFPKIEVHATRPYHTQKPDRDWLEGRDFDAWALMGTAAKYFRQSDDAFSGEPFLKIDEERALQWRALLKTIPGRKIGIAWTGGFQNTFRERRSLSLERLVPILKTRGVTWISLQYEEAQDEIDEFVKKHGISVKHWPRASETFDYDETAALVSELDLVISVCTTMVHLCGAIGKDCWCLVPSKARWFYQMKGRSVPWYKSVELFRQSSEQWPFEEIVERLVEKFPELKAPASKQVAYA